MLPQEAQIAESSYTFAMAISASIASSIPFFNNRDVNNIAIVTAFDLILSSLRPTVDDFTARKVAEEKRNDNKDKPSTSFFFENSEKIKDYLDHFLFKEIEANKPISTER